MLALIGEDKTITLSDSDGNTLSQREMKHVVKKDSVHFSPDGNTVSTMFFIIKSSCHIVQKKLL